MRGDVRYGIAVLTWHYIGVMDVGPCCSCMGGVVSLGRPCGYKKAPSPSEIATDGPCHKDSQFIKKKWFWVNTGII